MKDIKLIVQLRQVSGLMLDKDIACHVNKVAALERSMWKNRYNLEAIQNAWG